MNITFLIGNGFDLNCGLHTKFTDMYPEYLDTESHSIAIAEFKRNIREDKDMHYEKWSDFEMGIANYASKVKSENDILDCLEDFTEFLVDYLKKQQAILSNSLLKTPERIQNTIQEVKKSVLSFFGELPRNNDIYRIKEVFDESTYIHYSFISYNYTTLLDYLLNILFAKNTNYLSKFDNKRIILDKIEHIHGTLDKDTVIGIDNESQLSGLPYSLSKHGKDALIKPHFNDSYDSRRVASVANAIQSSDVLCVYGLSLGDSDLTWRQMILSWLKTSPSHYLVVFSKKYSDLETTVVWRKQAYEDEAKQEFLNKIGCSEDEYEALSYQVSVPIGSNIFNIGTLQFTETRGTKTPTPPAFVL